jgi:hypothetical protein
MDETCPERTKANVTRIIKLTKNHGATTVLMQQLNAVAAGTRTILQKTRMLFSLKVYFP